MQVQRYCLTQCSADSAYHRLSASSADCSRRLWEQAARRNAKMQYRHLDAALYWH
ncbi:hypothetical protein TSUD_124240 [Trifolium subterraneum]|uniref:Uncharacterized protein n=1 Tax=Trifolium subterraneum TaxID=3900 RepID=A0A2Z6M962_TRISU|nr:hypothetical protein TSUD_124240 [Trifolium subterraneum]